ncbi:MAG: hypothetical protein ABSG91_10460 [Syntrophobacteraceae bacterium]|jgi:BMFP domain-containing protein YqiC
MDRQFLEFWGNSLLNAAKNRKQLEDMTKWMGSGFTGFEETTSLFRKLYGLEKLEQSSPDYLKVWAEAQENFTKSFKDFFALLDVVPREEYLALVKKYEELKERVESQEETIKHLRMLGPEDKKEEYLDLAGHFEGLVKQQGEQFQKLMTVSPGCRKRQIPLNNILSSA